MAVIRRMRSYDPMVVVVLIGLLSQPTWSWLTSGSRQLLSKAALQLSESPRGKIQLHADNADPGDGLSRRDWFSQLSKTASAAALATTLVPTHSALAVAPAVVTSTAVCDPTVSVWQLSDRLVYLLGTAHISQLSADLAGQLVQDVRPAAVFVELDLKRVGGAKSGRPVTLAATSSSVSSDAESATAAATTTTTESRRTEVIVPVPTLTASSTDLVPPEPTPGDSSNAAAPKKQRQPFGLGMASALVGNALKGMYKSLGDSGFSPGEEFATAIRQGQAVNAAIVLGDRDVEVTLKRLTQALAVTDLDKLLNPNSQLEQSMKQIFGGSAEPQLANSKQDPDAFQKELSSYVENMKDRETVRTLIQEFDNVAPALVQVMLKERDAYMAAGLNSLQQFDTIVAVMGLAHMDGVEMNLRQQGWKPVPLTCPIPTTRSLASAAS